MTPNAARQRFQLPLLLGLVVAGLAGNYFKFPIFLSIDFLFGSVFAMLALQLCGVWRGTLAAALIAGMTFVLWNHPYAIVIMSAEVLLVGLLMRRYPMGMLAADALYWLLLGMPLVYLFYHLVMGVPHSNAAITMSKQAVNGVANALLARLLFAGIAHRFRPGHVSLHELLGNLLTAFLLFPALALLALGSRADFVEVDAGLRSALRNNSASLSGHLERWLQERTHAVVAMSELAATESAQQMQPRLLQLHATDGNFLRIGLRLAQPGGQSLIAAYAPAQDASGQSNIGKLQPDRTYIQTLRQSLKPLLAEVVPGRIDKPEPIAMLLAPVLVQGHYTGYVNAVLRLDQLRIILDTRAGRDALLYTLLDREGKVVLSNRPEQKMMQPLVRDPGQLVRIDAQVSQWLPTMPTNTTVSEQWRRSTYTVTSSIGGAGGWQLLLELPVAPHQQRLYETYANKLALLFVILLATLVIAELLSRRATAALERLGAVTQTLADSVAHRQTVDWPHSNIAQINRLIDNFKAMTASLVQQFGAIDHLNATLEQRIAARTAELTESETRFRTMFEANASVMLLLDPHSGQIEDVNQAAVDYYGYSRSQLIRMRVTDINTLPLTSITRQREQALAQKRTFVPFVHRLASGELRDVEVYSSPIDMGGRTVLFNIVHDVTERKALQEQVRQLAYFDPLTGLPNRRMLSDRLTMALAASQRSGLHGALMFLDLDNFKPLNDAHGHDAGDLLLVEVARRLQGCVRAMDTVARFGGDEFVVMLSELTPSHATSLEEGRAVAEKIRLALAAPYLLTLHRRDGLDTAVSHHCTASIGVALFVNHQVSQDELLKQADAAMYAAKDAGRNTLRIYEQTGVFPSD